MCSSDLNEETGYFVLVMEDMAPAEQGDQIRGCSVEEARVAVKELARLHGPRWGDESLFRYDWMERRTSSEDGERLNGLVNMFLPGFVATLGARVQEDTDGKGVDFLENMARRIVPYVTGKGEPVCVTHGDYRLDNILFDSTGDSLRCAVVDWQTPGHGNGVADLSYFIGAGLMPAERRVHDHRIANRCGSYDIANANTALRHFP